MNGVNPFGDDVAVALMLKSVGDVKRRGGSDRSGSRQGPQKVSGESSGNDLQPHQEIGRSVQGS